GDFHMPYETGVVDQWTGEYAGNEEGLREALLLAAEAAANPADHAVLTGTAKSGTVLRLKKEFQTATGAICTYAQGYVNAQTPADCVAPGDVETFDDKVDTTMVVPRSGQVEWHVNPSTRPFVTGRYEPGDVVPIGEPMTFEPTLDENRAALGLLDEGEGSVEREFDYRPAEGVDILRVRLEWTAQPEDFDLKLFKRQSGGRLKPIGIGATDTGYSGNLPGTFEEINVLEPTAGKYVLRVIYYATAANDWTATVEQLEQLPDVWQGTGQTEAYTLTCETPDGTVLGSREVTVLRGHQVELAMPDGCGARRRVAEDVVTRIAGAPAPPAAAPSGDATARRAGAVRFRVRPRRDRTRPYRYRVTGSVLAPAGLSKAESCAGGTVRVALRKRGRTVGRRMARVAPTCRFSTRVTSRRKGRLQVAVRFAGSSALAASATRSATVRAG
ncbi:MAG TPA: hypothetical protein VHF89_09690, partial [Solirubrobacteraceae bacterium]|nr:hypothetical protein [Solirubrobacteraceae bacterium]